MAEFPPNEIKGVLGVVIGLLKERGETVAVGETVSFAVSEAFYEIYQK